MQQNARILSEAQSALEECWLCHWLNITSHRIVHKYGPMHAHKYKLLVHDSLIFKILEGRDTLFTAYTSST